MHAATQPALCESNTFNVQETRSVLGLAKQVLTLLPYHEGALVRQWLHASNVYHVGLHTACLGVVGQFTMSRGL